MDKEQEFTFEKTTSAQNELKLRTNHTFLTDNQISILKRNQIHYEEYPNAKSLLFALETELNENPDADEELEIISEQLSEISYYQDTNK